MLGSGFEKAAERLEKPHDFWLAKDVGEYFEICAEFGESIEGHQAVFLIRIVRIIRHHTPVHTAKNLDDVLVLKDFHQLYDLRLRIVAFFGLLDLLVQR